jgi:hypothetical protein
MPDKVERMRPQRFQDTYQPMIRACHLHWQQFDQQARRSTQQAPPKLQAREAHRQVMATAAQVVQGCLYIPSMPRLKCK